MDSKLKMFYFIFKIYCRKLQKIQYIFFLLIYLFIFKILYIIIKEIFQRILKIINCSKS